MMVRPAKIARLIRLLVDESPRLCAGVQPPRADHPQARQHSVEVLHTALGHGAVGVRLRNGVRQRPCAATGARRVQTRSQNAMPLWRTPLRSVRYLSR